jgi:glycerophosphoryl diester phosphodiesterase
VTVAIAHRGEPVGHRENTLPAFVAARRAGADVVELDCRLTRDGAVVVLHDPTLKRLWGVDRRIGDLDLDEVRALGREGCRVPQLWEVLDTLDLPLMVDVADPSVMPAALSAVAAAGALDRCLFAGHLSGLRAVRRAQAGARLALTWDSEAPPGDALLQELHPEYFNPRWDLLTAERAEYFHSRGLKISVWTVDDPGVMARLVHLGVDAIITNRIAELVALLARTGGD